MKEIGWRWHFYAWCFAPAALLWNYLRCRKQGPYKGNTLIVILSVCCYASTFTTWTFLCRQRWSCRQGAQVTAAEGVDWSLMATPRPAVTVCGSGHQLSLGPWELSKNSDNKSNRVDYIFPFFFLFLRGCLLRNSLSFPLFFFRLFVVVDYSQLQYRQEEQIQYHDLKGLRFYTCVRMPMHEGFYRFIVPLLYFLYRQYHLKEIRCFFTCSLSQLHCLIVLLLKNTNKYPQQQQKQSLSLK